MSIVYIILKKKEKKTTLQKQRFQWRSNFRYPIHVSDALPTALQRLKIRTEGKSI